MSGSFESVRWNARVHRLDLGLHSHLKEFWGNGVRTHNNSKGKIQWAIPAHNLLSNRLFTLSVSVMPLEPVSPLHCWIITYFLYLMYNAIFNFSLTFIRIYRVQLDLNYWNQPPQGTGWYSLLHCWSVAPSSSSFSLFHFFFMGGGGLLLLIFLFLSFPRCWKKERTKKKKQWKERKNEWKKEWMKEWMKERSILLQCSFSWYTLPWFLQQSTCQNRHKEETLQPHRQLGAGPAPYHHRSMN